MRGNAGKPLGSRRLIVAIGTVYVIGTTIRRRPVQIGGPVKLGCLRKAAAANSASALGIDGGGDAV